MSIADRIDPASWKVIFPQRIKRHKYSKGFGLCDGFAVGSSTASHKEGPTWWHNDEPRALTFGDFKEIAVRGSRANEIVGFWTKGDKVGAVMWRSGGNGELSQMELHSSDFNKTYAMGVGGGAQVGFGVPKVKKGEHAKDRALLWQGSNEVFVLRSSVDVDATSFGTDGEFQVGSIGNRAALWRGPNSEPVIIGGDKGYSEAHAVRDGEQVGTLWKGMCARAVMWKGTPDSLIDLTPNGFQSASATDCAGGFQVGYVKKKDLTPSGSSSMNTRAAIWNGTNEFFDLQTLLPTPWNTSAATSIEIVGDTIRIVGEAVNVVTTGPGLQASEAMAESTVIVWSGKLR